MIFDVATQIAHADDRVHPRARRRHRHRHAGRRRPGPRSRRAGSRPATSSASRSRASARSRTPWSTSRRAPTASDAWAAPTRVALGRRRRRPLPVPSASGNPGPCARAPVSRRRPPGRPVPPLRRPARAGLRCASSSSGPAPWAAPSGGGCSSTAARPCSWRVVATGRPWPPRACACATRMATTSCTPVAATPAELGWRDGRRRARHEDPGHRGRRSPPWPAAAGPDVRSCCAQNGVENERLALRRFRQVYGMCVMLPGRPPRARRGRRVRAPRSPAILDVGRYPSGTDDVTPSRGRAGGQLLRRRLRTTSCAGSTPSSSQPRQRPRGRAGRAGRGPADLHRTGPDEALACFAAAGIGSADAEDDRTRRAAMSAPRPIGGRTRAGSSSWQSLARGTGRIEADWLNGEIVLLGRLHGIPTPVNERLQLVAGDLARRGGPPAASRSTSSAPGCGRTEGRAWPAPPAATRCHGPETRRQRGPATMSVWATCSTTTPRTRPGTSCSKPRASPAPAVPGAARRPAPARRRRRRRPLRQPRPQLPRPGHHLLAVGRGAPVPARPGPPHHPPPASGRTIEAGVAQRVRALEAFLADVYGAAEILADGLVPRGAGRHARPTSTGRPPGSTRPTGCASTWPASTSSATSTGGSGSSRTTCAPRRASPTSSRTAGRCPGCSPSCSRATGCGPSSRTRPAAARLAGRRRPPAAGRPHGGRAHARACTTPPTSSTRSWPARWAWSWSRAATSSCRDERRVPADARPASSRVDVIYRRVDDDFLDPLHFRPDSVVGLPRAPQRRPGRQRGPRQRGRQRRGRRQAHLHLRARHDPTTTWARTRSCPTSPTYRLDDPDQLADVLDRLDQLVLKPVDASGGYGHRRSGPSASDEQLATVRDRRPGRPPGRGSPRSWSQLSTVAHPRRRPAAAPPRRPAARSRSTTASGSGSCPAASPGWRSPEGNLVVNSSQGGGSKDTWVLADGGDAGRARRAQAQASPASLPARAQRRAAPDPGPVLARAPAASNSSSSSSPAAGRQDGGRRAEPHRRVAVLGRPLRRAGRGHRPHPRRARPAPAGGPRGQRGGGRRRRCSA